MNIEKKSPQRRIEIIDIIKALCALFPIWAHSRVFYSDRQMVDLVLQRDHSLFFLLFVEMCVPIFMILSGITLSLKYSDKSLRDMLDKRTLVKRVVSLSVPIFFVVIAYVVCSVYEGSNFIKILKSVIKVRFGYGAYYYPMMVEYLVVGPIVLWVVRRYRGLGVLCIAAINLLWEIFCRVVGFPEDIYRILIFRYLTYIAIGVYAFYWLREHDLRQPLRHWFSPKQCCIWIVGFAIGLAYKAAPYFGYTYRFCAFHEWGRTALFSALYVFPLVFICLYCLHDCHIAHTRTGRRIIEVGQSSYHIMCAQMIYFNVRLKIFGHLILGASFPERMIALIIDTIICVPFGLLFAHVDRQYLSGPLLRRLGR